MTDTNGYVQTEIEEGVGVISFFHPQRNSLPGSMLDALARAVEKAGQDPAILVVLLKSQGDNVFCAGASFDELSSIQVEEQGLDFFMGFANVINAMRTCPKFIIARIQGRCVGGGVGLAAVADYSLALDNADIKLSELAVGIGPFVVGPAVERKLGLSAFSQLAIDAHAWHSAEWARQMGLFAEIHPTEESLDQAIQKLVKTLSQANPEAMSEMKKIFWAGTEHWDVLLPERAAISGRLVLSDFCKKAIASFKSK
jgi:methylglutaconyl-CoA hydratase